MAASCRLSPIDGVSALLERGSEAPKGRIKHRTHQDGERTAFKLILDEKFDITRVSARGMKGPAVLEPLEGTVEVFDNDFEIGPVKCDAAGKCLTNDLVGNRHVNYQDGRAVVLVVEAFHRQGTAERHKFRIFPDVRDQIEHVRGGVADASLRRELRHNRSGRGGARGLEAREVLTGVMG